MVYLLLNTSYKKNMKESRYNIYFKAEDGEKLAFNAMSCGLAVVDDTYEELIRLLPNINEELLSDEIKDCFEAAIEGHFIVDDEDDELIELKTKRDIQKFSVDSLGLTIAPTLACNFKCIYCYETSKPGVMTENVIDGLTHFVEEQVPHLKNLSVSWYGGEPLMAKSVVYELSERFISLCDKNNIAYDAFIISNGSLLDDDTIVQLEKYRIRGIQITIDGPSEYHDARRISKSGQGTFDIIIDNINKILRSNKMEVVIRINVDKTNKCAIDNLISILAEKLINKDVKITFGQVTAYTEACRSIESSCYSNAEFAAELVEYYNILEKYGFDDYNEFPYPEVKLNYCCAELINSFVVDHEGFMYKCWNEVGNITKAVGNLSNGEYDISCRKNGMWVARNPFEVDKCKECNVLPICMGGCPHNDIVLGKDNVCDLIKYNIKDVMLKYYEKSKEE